MEKEREGGRERERERRKGREKGKEDLGWKKIEIESEQG